MVSDSDELEGGVLGDVGVVAVVVEHGDVEANGNGRDEGIGLRTNGDSPPPEFSVDSCGIEPIELGGERFVLLCLKKPLGSGYSISPGAGHYLQQDWVEGNDLSTGDCLAHPLRLG